MTADERRDPDFYRAIESWALRALIEQPATVTDLPTRLLEESAGNLKYRADGAIRVSPRQVNLLVGRLRRRGLIKPGPEPGSWSASARGRSELERLQNGP